MIVKKIEDLMSELIDLDPHSKNNLLFGGNF